MVELMDWLEDLGYATLLPADHGLGPLGVLT